MLGRKKGGRCAVILVLCAVAAFGQKNEPSRSSADSLFVLQLTPGLTIPVGRDVDAFSLGGGASLLAQLVIPSLPFLAIEGGAGYSLAPLKVASGEPVTAARLSLLSPRVGLSVTFEPLSRLRLSAHAHGGWYFGFLDIEDPSNAQSGALLDAGVDITYELVPSLTLGLGASYRLFFGLSNDVLISLGTAYRFPVSKGGGILSPELKPNPDLLLGELALEPVFPVFYKYYDDHPIGALTISNRGKAAIDDLVVKVYAATYMDDPRVCREIPALRPGESATVVLTALFNERVLDISESTKVSMNVSVESARGKQRYGNETVQTLRLYDRNAITWDDDRKVAAFVTAKDPRVLQFAKGVSSMVSGKAARVLNQNMLAAIAFHEALTLYGVRYVVDPTTPYQQLSQTKATIDYLQSPNQTLGFKAGDCDDLSILYCALLEAVGVRTAFITVPGHIYSAFSLGIGADEARRSFPRSDDFIFIGGQAWVPVEVTSIGPGFLAAWQLGAREWRENQNAGAARLYPTGDAQSVYEPVGLPGGPADLVMPDSARIERAFTTEVRRVVDLQIAPQVAALNARIGAAGTDLKAINLLGVLYARYGLYDEAAVQFQRILARQKDYVPALVNMGNIALLRSDAEAALGFYRRAAAKEATNSQALLGLTKASWELSRFDDAGRTFAQLKRVDPGLADRYTFLESKPANDTARGAAVDQASAMVEWSE
jgi:transglutaminase-like putative cysteine protease